MHKEVLKKKSGNPRLDSQTLSCTCRRVKAGKKVYRIFANWPHNIACARAWDGGTDSTQGYYRLG